MTRSAGVLLASLLVGSEAAAFGDDRYFSAEDMMDCRPQARLVRWNWDGR